MRHFILILLYLAGSVSAQTARPRVVSSDETGVTLELSALNTKIKPVELNGESYDRVTVRGGAWPAVPGVPALPEVATLIGIPFGVDLRASIIDARYELIEDVRVHPVPSPHVRGREPHVFSSPAYRKDETVYGRDAFVPVEPVSIRRTGIVRDQRVAALTIRPIRYNPVRETLEIAQLLRVRVTFVAVSQRPALLPSTEDREHPFESTYNALLPNAASARAWRRRPLGGSAKQALSWYDPLSDWYKIFVTADAVYRLDSPWFEEAGMSLLPGDLDRLQMLVDGQEQPLLVRDGGDGVLDDGEAVLFYGRYRRDSNRDFENEFGRERTYWLRLGSDSGRRFTPVDGSVSGTLPDASTFTCFAHSEVDSAYQPLGYASDAERDHWYGSYTASPSSQGARQFDVVHRINLPGLNPIAGEVASVSVGMHGLTARDDINPDHLTRVDVGDGVLVNEVSWDGSTAFIVSGAVDASELEDPLTVTLSTPGSPKYFQTDGGLPYVDHVLFNWVRVTYPRVFDAVEGNLAFSIDLNVGEAGRSVSVRNLRTATTTVIGLSNGDVLTDTETVQEGDTFRTRFDVRSEGDYLAFDEDAVIAAPPGVLDTATDLLGEIQGAAYVVITHGDYRFQAELLADHRRSQGMTAMVVDVQDVFDEFAFGHLTETSIQDFMVHAFSQWSERPVYLLLVGRHSYDYRDLLDQAKLLGRTQVPSMRFQSVRRGIAFTDHFYGTVSGGDSLMDLYVGRFSMNNTREADSIVRKVIEYDQTPNAGWRDRALFLANWDIFLGETLFIEDSDGLIERYAEPFGLEINRVYHDENTPPAPNESSSEVIRQWNEGQLLVNFMGHGSSATMQDFISGVFQQRGYNYVGQIQNEEMLPLVIAMSCLNGSFADPLLTCFAEEMTKKDDGGAIGYVSASTLAFVFVNNFVSDVMFRLFFEEGITSFGEVIAIAKNEILTQFPGNENGVVMMQLMGDPAQRLAILEGSDVGFADGALSISPSGDLLAVDTARVVVRIDNDGVRPNKDIELLIVDRNFDQGVVDTLFVGSIPPIGQRDSLAVAWPLEGRAGRHRIEVVLDPSNKLNDLDPSNNFVAADVKIFGALTTIPLFPLEHQVVFSSNVVLGIRSGGTVLDLIGEFEVNSDGDFEGPSVIASGPISGVNGLATFRVGGLVEGDYVWRARLLDEQEGGPWTRGLRFTVGEGADRNVIWQQDTDVIASTSSLDGIEVNADGTLGRTTVPLSLKLNADRREVTFDSEETPATAILATDGTFIYATGFNAASELYPSGPTFTRIGTGFNGTVAGQSLGPLTEIPINTTSATFHGDGFLYADIGFGNEILRIRTDTGEAERVDVPDGLIEVQTGLVIDGFSLITSDGKDIYNVAWGIDGVRRAGWTVRVFRPEENWRLLRTFTVEPTSSGFTYQFTDGVIADGQYLYLVEFGTGVDHRVRVIDAQDGRLIEEFDSDQGTTDILSGQYDWVNNKVWMGQLNGPGIFRYEGRQLPDEGIVLSAPIGPAGAWSSASTVLKGSTGSVTLGLLGEGPGGLFAPIAEFTGLNARGVIDLSGLDRTIDRIQLRLRLSGPDLAPTSSLGTWEVRYEPESDLRLSGLRFSSTVAEELEPIDVSIDVTNFGPLDLVIGMTVAFYAGSPEAGWLIRRRSVPEDTPIGATRAVTGRWETGQFPGVHRVWARVEDLQGEPSFFDIRLASEEPVEILGSGDLSPPTTDIVAVDAFGEVRAEDYLPSSTRFDVTIRDSSGVDATSVLVELTGESSGAVASFGTSSGEAIDRATTPKSITFSFAPTDLIDDRYTLTVSATDRVGNGPATKTLSFQVSSELALEQVLAYPNPTDGAASFTYILSQPASVTIRVFTLAGRLTREIEAPISMAGYNQVAWDGLDADGHPLANGTYLYTVTAETADSEIRNKEKLIVYR